MLASVRSVALGRVVVVPSELAKRRKFMRSLSAPVALRNPIHLSFRFHKAGLASLERVLQS